MLMLHTILLALLILTLEEFYKSQGAALIHLTLRDFKNPGNIKHDGNICDTNTLMDFCDPVFYICLSQITECGIYNESTKIIHNTPMIFSKEFQFERIPTKFDVKVIASDADNGGSHELIGVFQHTFINLVPKNKFIREISLNNLIPKVTLVVDLSVKCTINYYGPHCTDYCKSEVGIYTCDDKTGKKTCLLTCSKYQQCGRNPDSGQYYLCVCKPGYGGQHCKTKPIDNINIKLSTLVPTTPTAIRTTKPFTTREVTKIIQTKQAATTTSQNSKSTIFRINSTESIGAGRQTNYFTFSVQSHLSKTLYTKNNISFTMKYPKTESSYNLSTIVIISLLILLCFFMLIMMFMIKKWNTIKNNRKRKNYPLPPVNYHASNYDKICQVPNNTRNPEIPTTSTQIHENQEPSINTYDYSIFEDEINEKPSTRNTSVYVCENRPVKNREGSNVYISIKNNDNEDRSSDIYDNDC